MAPRIPGSEYQNGVTNFQQVQDFTLPMSSRPLYRHHELKRIFNPRNIAVVGASPNSSSFASQTILRLNRYQGQVFRVNPRYQQIGEHRCYSAIADLPESPDCVVVAVPQEGVEAVVRQCAEAKVGGVVIFASGYAETGKSEGIAMQERLAALAQESDLRILGPNCIGFASFESRAIVTFTRSEIRLSLTGEGIGMVSQSGALGFSVSQAAQRGVAVSHIIAGGNSCDVDIADIIAYLADAPSCKAIVCIFEGMSHPHRLIEAAHIAWAADKPLIVCKLGATEAGATAALSHSGSLAGSTAAYKAAFERAGIIMVDDLEALMETASFFAKAPRRPLAPGVAVVAPSGGAAVFATDKASFHQVSMPQPNPETRSVLERVVPEYGSARNPCDLTTKIRTDPRIIPESVEAMARDSQYGAVVFPQTGVHEKVSEELALVGAACARHGKIACVSWISGWLSAHGAVECEENRQIALFFSMDRCMNALAEWNKREKRRSTLEQKGEENETRTTSPGVKAEGLALLRAGNSRILTEREAKTILNAYGVPVIQEQLAVTVEDAVSIAQKIGFPVVLKIESPDIQHKTDVGGVYVDVRNSAEVEQIFGSMLANVRKAKVTAKIDGVLVQKMAPPGIEVMVGAKIDPLFGPLIVLSLGGVLVELAKDPVVDLAPVDNDGALAMISRLKAEALLSGFRGAKPVDLKGLSRIIMRVSEMAVDLKDEIEAIDVNPLICSGNIIVAVDALIAKRQK